MGRGPLEEEATTLLLGWGILGLRANDCRKMSLLLCCKYCCAAEDDAVEAAVDDDDDATEDEATLAVSNNGCCCCCSCDGRGCCIDATNVFESISRLVVTTTVFSLLFPSIVRGNFGCPDCIIAQFLSSFFTIA